MKHARNYGWVARIQRAGYMALWLIAVTGCATAPPDDPFVDFHTAQPRSLLVVPVVNRSVDVEAPTSVLTTLPRVLAEKGYYVFPVNTTRTMLEFEGLYEPAEIHAMPPDELAGLFGADAILYVTIHEWTSQYLVVQTTTIVDFEYRIVYHDGSELWTARKRLTHRPEADRSDSRAESFITAAVTAAIERAHPRYLPLTRQANQEVFYTGPTALPPGPYAPDYADYYRRVNKKYGRAEESSAGAATSSEAGSPYEEREADAP